MKKLVIVVAFFIFLEGYSQTWKYYSKENAFDGKFKMCYVTTKGVFPYSEPYLAIQSHEKNNEIDIFIADAGRYDLDEYVAVLWSFNNEPDVVYRTWELLFSKSGAIFNEQKFYTPPDYTDINKAKFLTKFEFINKIMSASSVSVRIKGKYNELLDLDFSLRGSSKAINYVIPNLSSLILEEKIIQDKQNLLKLELAEQKKKQAEEEEQQKLERVALLKQYEIARLEKIDKTIKKIEPIIQKYSHQPLRDAILKNLKFKIALISNIKNVKVKIYDYNKEAYWYLRSIVELDDGSEIVTFPSFIKHLKISKRMLKSMGGAENVPF